MKTCFKCSKELPLSEFYRHPAMGDGYLGKCKTCTKQDTADRVARKQKDPDWVIAEAERCRIKAERARENGTAVKLTGEKRAQVLRKSSAKHPEKTKARTVLGNAIRDGKIKRLPCEVCGSLDSEGHHEDYSKPLDVNWLCPKHHSERHVQINNERRRKKALAA